MLDILIFFRLRSDCLLLLSLYIGLLLRNNFDAGLADRICRAAGRRMLACNNVERNDRYTVRRIRIGRRRAGNRRRYRRRRVVFEDGKRSGRRAAWRRC
jgi:hypothetical protein